IRLTLPALVRLPRGLFVPAVGVLFGAMAVGAMQGGPMLEGGIRGSLHNIVLVSSAVFGGPVAALIAAAVAALYRVALGGMVPVALVGMAGATALGIAFHRWVVVPRGTNLRTRDFLALGAVLAVVNVALPFGLTAFQPEKFPRAVELAVLILPVVLVFYPLGVTALCEFVREELKRIEDAAALKRANIELAENAEALRQSEARFRDFADAASDWLWETDAEHRFTFVSTSHGLLLQSALHPAIGRTRWDFVGADLDDPNWHNHLADMEAQRPFTGFEYSWASPSGTTRWIRVSGRPYYAADGSFAGYRGAATDRTVQRRIEIALEESEERLRALIDNLPDLVSLKDSDGRYLMVNERFLEAHGLPASQVIGKTVRDVAPADEAAAIMAHERRVHETGQPIRRETDLTFAGTRLAVIVTKFLVASPTGGPALIGTVMTDVTEFKRLREQLHHVQKMETVGQLTGGLAHDFNNLLTVIIGNLELLMDHLHRSPPLLRFAETAHSGAIRAAELTRRLLAFSRRQSLRPVAFDLNELVTGMTALLQRTLGAEIELATELAADLVPALADPGQVESVLLNLAVNARDAMPAGGRLTVATATVELDEEYAWSHDEVRPGAYVLLTVTDTGDGMTPETAERAFEPFFTTKEVGKGTGLGLSMVYGFVKQSGGHVELSSAVGRGTTVKVYLPRAVAATATFPRRVAAQSRPAERGRETVLVVEDDPMVRAFAVEQLGSLGYTVVEASSGSDALTKLDGRHIDLLFSDVVMPGGMSGFDLAKVAMTRRPSLRILFTSGYAEEAMRQQGHLRPGMRLLSKPYPKSALAAAIRDLLDQDEDAAASGRARP
ncbi:MAG: PAS domain S-box protein, partial [Candidatus Eiseniibacteriota bacterium]